MKTMSRSQLEALAKDPVLEVERYRAENNIRIETLAYEAEMAASTYRSLTNGQTSDPRQSTTRKLVIWRLAQ